MNVDKINPPRTFEVGKKKKLLIRHCANIFLEPNEQVTFVSPQGEEVDVVKKDWGYYLTPSMNKRMKNFNLNTYLVQNSVGNVFVMTVEQGKDREFNEYIEFTHQKVIINLSDIYCVS